MLFRGMTPGISNPLLIESSSTGKETPCRIFSPKSGEMSVRQEATGREHKKSEATTDLAPVKFVIPWRFFFSNLASLKMCPPVTSGTIVTQVTLFVKGGQKISDA